MTDTPSPEAIEFDIRGQICPSCLLLALRELNRNSTMIRGGQAEMKILTDDRQATSTIPEMAGRMGYTTSITRDDTGYQIRIFAH